MLSRQIDSSYYIAREQGPVLSTHGINIVSRQDNGNMEGVLL